MDSRVLGGSQVEDSESLLQTHLVHGFRVLRFRVSVAEGAELLKVL